MDNVTIGGFLDELEKIAEKSKKRSWAIPATAVGLAGLTIGAGLARRHLEYKALANMVSRAAQDTRSLAGKVPRFSFGPAKAGGRRRWNAATKTFEYPPKK